MKNSFWAVLEGKKEELKTQEKEKIKQSHSREFLSGIFNACCCSYKIEKPLLSKQPLRGRLRVTAFREDSFFYEQQLRGFTLIELLVVVLIIGILAAVALPQYQQAVEKTRTSNLLPILRAIDNAQKTYLLSNGNYADDFSKLDIDMPAGFTDAQDSAFRTYNNFKCWVYEQQSFSCQSFTGPRLEKYYTSDFLVCWHNQDAQLKRICQSLLNSDCSSHETYCSASF